jgi:hypothetical protein
MKLIVLALLAAGAFAVAAADPHPDPPPGEPQPPRGSRLQDEPWVVRSVSRDGRTLQIEGRGGGCGHDPRARAVETASSVRIRVQQLVPADLSHIRCKAIARIDILRVELSAPIAGRELPGQTLGSAMTGLNPTVPRVVGLRTEEARFSLRAQGFEVEARATGVVLDQMPRPGAPVPGESSTVTLLAR